MPFLWLVLFAVFIMKYSERENPLYKIVARHAQIGGVTQIFTSLPAYVVFTAVPGDGSLLEYLNIILYCGFSSIVAMIAMAVYDIKLIRTMMKLQSGEEEAVK